jgi:hypothetical protein
MILVVAHNADEHGKTVAERLREMKHDVAVVDLSNIWAAHAYAIDPLEPGFEDGWTLCRILGLPDGEISAVYWRRPISFELALDYNYPTGVFVARAEAYHAVRLTIENLPESLFPLGHPNAHARAGNKLKQLAAAKRYGFCVPESLVGNSSQLLREFLERHSDVVVKPLHVTAVYSSANRTSLEKQLWCTALKSATLRERLQVVDKSQLFVQKRVDKRADWRITVLPHAAFCCEIDAGTMPPHEADWRKFTKSLPHRLVEMPQAFEAKLRGFLRELQTPAGYFDFAIPADGGEPLFLEMNTNAQWLWIEQRTGAPISREIAKCLAGA